MIYHMNVFMLRIDTDITSASDVEDAEKRILYLGRCIFFILSLYK